VAFAFALTFRRKPPGDIAQAVLDLMVDPTRWTVEAKALRHKDVDLVIRKDWSLREQNQWPLAALVGDHVFPFRDDQDFGPVLKAYKRLRRDAEKHAEDVAGQEIRAKLALAPAPPKFSAEPIEVVEARVRHLREAMISAPPQPTSPDAAA